MKKILSIIRRIIGIEDIKTNLEIINLKLNNELNEIKKAIIFNNSITDCEWLKYRNFSPGYWACDYACLFTLFRVLNDMHPKAILEFGLGQSSKLIHQYANYFNDVTAITCEHDVEWVKFFNNHQKNYIIKLLHLELEEVQYKNKSTLTYKGLISKLFNGREGVFDFIFVDGPYGSDNYSRSQVIHLIKKNLNESFCIIMDDYNRKGEKETIQEVMNILYSEKKEFSHRIFVGEKEHILLCSKDLKFLTSI
jgi:16S rRNA G966 N2-methylase RsmD